MLNVNFKPFEVWEISDHCWVCRVVPFPNRWRVHYVICAIHTHVQVSEQMKENNQD
jgi:hypothetical protein